VYFCFKKGNIILRRSLKEVGSLGAEINNQWDPHKVALEGTERLTGKMVWVGVVFFCLTALFALCLIIQIFLAGLAIFAEPVYWASHTTFVHMFEIIPLLMMVLALVGRLPRKLIWQSVGLLLLIFLMYLTANIGALSPYVAATHPVMAMIMFWVAHKFMINVWRLVRGTAH
jgi:hypothetical protein